MNRRGFLGALTGLASGMALDPERMLWRPGAKLISIPKPQVLGGKIGDGTKAARGLEFIERRDYSADQIALITRITTGTLLGTICELRTINFSDVRAGTMLE